MVHALALSRQRVVQNGVNKTSMRKSTVQGSCLRHSEQRVGGKAPECCHFGLINSLRLNTSSV